MQGNIIVDYLPVNTYINKIDPINQIVYTKNNNNNKYGFINLKENVIVEPVYEYFLNFVDKISVAELNNKYGFINNKNEVIIDFMFSNANNFSEGLASVRYNSKYGYIDKLGNIVIDYQYFKASDFKDGVAVVDDNKFINTNNEIIIPIHNSSHDIEYKNHYFSYDISKYYYVNDDGSVFYKSRIEDYGLIIEEESFRLMTKITNNKGKVIIEKEFRNIEYKSDNLFCIETNERNEWECYDMKGEKLFDYVYNNINAFTQSPYIYLQDNKNQYVYDTDVNLIYKSDKDESYLRISKSNDFIVTTKGNKIISYNISTKEKKVIYKIPFFKSLFSWKLFDK